MAAGDTQITIAGNPSTIRSCVSPRAAGREVPDRVHPAVSGQEHERVEGRRPSLRNASAKVNKVARSGSGDGGSQRGFGGRSPGGDADPWAAEGPGGYSDEPPF